MKKRILALSLLIVTTISYSFADSTRDINRNVLISFTKDFTGAREVIWESTTQFAKATFRIDNQVMFAYYSPDGDLMAVTRYISPDFLPINQLTSLKKNYGNYWVSDLFEMNSDGETTYYITLENGDHKLILKSVSSAGWEVYNKEKKEGSENKNLLLAKH